MHSLKSASGILSEKKGTCLVEGDLSTTVSLGEPALVEGFSSALRELVEIALARLMSFSVPRAWAPGTAWARLGLWARALGPALAWPRLGPRPGSVPGPGLGPGPRAPRAQRAHGPHEPNRSHGPNFFSSAPFFL